eukprot:403339663
MDRESNLIGGLGSFLYETLQEWIYILGFALMILFLGYLLLAVFQLIEANSQYYDEINYKLRLFIQDHPILVLSIMAILAFMTVRRIRMMRRRQFKKIIEEEPLFTYYESPTDRFTSQGMLNRFLQSMHLQESPEKTSLRKALQEKAKINQKYINTPRRSLTYSNQTSQNFESQMNKSSSPFRSIRTTTPSKTRNIYDRY